MPKSIDGESIVGDMYSMGNHEHDLLLSDGEDEIPSNTDPTSGESDLKRGPLDDRESDGFQSDTSSNRNDTSQSCSVGSEDESAKMLLESFDKEIIKPKTERTMKASLARKLMAFGVDTKASGDVSSE